MAKLSPKLALSDAEIDVLMRTERRLRIATVGPGADINLTPMTFGWASGRVYIYGRGQKVANLRRSSTATVLVDVGEQWRELKGIMMRGHARGTCLASSSPRLYVRHDTWRLLQIDRCVR